MKLFLKLLALAIAVVVLCIIVAPADDLPASTGRIAIALLSASSFAGSTVTAAMQISMPDLDEAPVQSPFVLNCAWLC